MRARHVTFAVSAACSVALGFLGAAKGVPAHHGMDVAMALGEASAVLFGVFGIWLGICYREEMHTEMVGKADAELKRCARGLIASAARCEVLFVGLAISSAIFVSALLLRVAYPIVERNVAVCTTTCFWLKGTFFSVVLFGVFAQIYGIMTPLVIMAEAVFRVRKTRRDAEDILRRSEQY